MKKLPSLTALGLGTLLLPSHLLGLDLNLRPDSAGFRGGWDAESEVSLTEISAYAVSPAWQSWSLGERSSLSLAFEGQFGGLHGEGETAVFAAIAPKLILSCTEFPLRIALSSGPAVYSEDTFGDYDIGNNFQFVSGIDIEYSLNDHWALGYRFQHTSNAGLSDENPGLNMHLLSLAHHF
ncbi:MAG: acyloxyacyl hydrolase [Verrucomicrobiota bacterium]